MSWPLRARIAAYRAAGIAPRSRIDGFLDQLDQGVHAFLERLGLFLLVLATAAASEEAAATAAATATAATPTAAATPATAAATAATTAAAATAAALVIQAEARGIVEVRDFDQQVADVVDAGDDVLRQVVRGRDRDDAFVDRVRRA